MADLNIFGIEGKDYIRTRGEEVFLYTMNGSNQPTDEEIKRFNYASEYYYLGFEVKTEDGVSVICNGQQYPFVNGMQFTG